MVYKSRNLSLYQFLNVLQKEYIVAEIRKKIYPKKNDKKYYQKLMKQKKEKIDDIALRNSFDTIFNNEETKEQIYGEVICEEGLPEFIYIDDKHQREFEPQDICNYYLPGSEVKIKDGETFVGTIKQVDWDNGKAEIELYDGETVNYKLKKVTRVL